MDESTTTRIVRRYRAAHRAPAADVFALLCPVREYDWIETWQCTLIHSASGVAELDCVFKTDFAQNGGPETWTCSCHEPPRRIDYIIVGAHHVTRLNIVLDEAADGGCSSVWTRVYTALDEEGARGCWRGSTRLSMRPSTRPWSGCSTTIWPPVPGCRWMRPWALHLSTWTSRGKPDGTGTRAADPAALLQRCRKKNGIPHEGPDRIHRRPSGTPLRPVAHRPALTMTASVCCGLRGAHRGATANTARPTPYASARSWLTGAPALAWGPSPGCWRHRKAAWPGPWRSDLMR